jgi:anaerobic ribonucleoside-triphosphate reductase activating protein
MTEASFLAIRLGCNPAGLKASLANGPGWRICIWTQGCSIRCTRDCLNTDMLDARGGWLVPVDALVERIVEIRRRETGARAVEGITMLGGEPSDQPAAVAQLFARSRALGLTTMLYSGWTLAALRRKAVADPALEELLATTDLLIDGPYQDRRYDDALPWRGSANQVLHLLSGAYDSARISKAMADQGKAFSIRFEANGSISVDGLQSPEHGDALRSKLYPDAV